jgi:hypothetical protein
MSKILAICCSLIFIVIAIMLYSKISNDDLYYQLNRKHQNKTKIARIQMLLLLIITSFTFTILVVLVIIWLF